MSKSVFGLAAISIACCVFAAGDYLQTGFEKADIKHNVNQKLLRAMGQHESGLKPYVVGFVVKDGGIAAAAEADLKASPVKYRKSSYRKWWHFSLNFANAEQAKQALPWLEKVTAASTGYDVGIMQINSRNAHRNGWDIGRLLTDHDYNIEKGAMILNDCRKIFGGDPAKTIECYNKGTKSSNFDYGYYSAVYSRYYGKQATPALPRKQADKKSQVIQAKKEFVLPRDYGSGRTLF